VPTFLVQVVALSEQRITTAVNLSFLDWSSHLSLNYLVIYTHEVEWNLSRPTISPEICYDWESNPGLLNLKAEILTTRAQRTREILVVEDGGKK
jgi:hypothetical protein